MNLLHKYYLSKKIRERKKECAYMLIEKISGVCYHLRDQGNTEFILNIEFDGLRPMPKVGDGFYLSENIIESIKENLFSFTFSRNIGEVYARPPHDFLKAPEEFLIFEYKNGRTVLLEQWYG